MFKDFRQTVRPTPPASPVAPTPHIPVVAPQPVAVAMPAADTGWHDLKQVLHEAILNQMNLGLIEQVERADLKREIGALVAPILQQRGQTLTGDRFRQLVNELMDEVLGLGPLEPLLADPTVSDILVNGPDKIFVERRGLLERSPLRFRDEKHLLRIIDKIVSRVGRRIDESQPWVDARLPDGSRVNAIIKPCAIDGASLSIRKFSADKLTLDKLVGYGALNDTAAQFLAACVQSRMNALISGGTGSGKTTMLNAMSAFIDHRQRIVTIEDAAELQLQQDHVVRLETRPANAEGTGLISQRELVKNALRMRPDRIVIGEVRGSEAFDMLQAMNTGHRGSMTTLHANSTLDAL
ncbi:MAG: CpaF family protein, partial [Alphaproteobacteria bacterium]|nr:CpaF family protein [Alphaproteobacteria bacterium]